MSAKLVSKAISTPKTSCPNDEFLYATSYSEPEDLKSLQLPFPAKLYNLLETADKSVIDWLPTGLAFKVHDMQRFTNEVLPKYFNRKQQSICIYFYSW